MHHEDLVVRQVGRETVVYDRRRHRAHCLRPLAAAVWRECDGQRAAAEIAERVSAAEGEPIDETAVRVTLRRLGRAGLIAPRSAGEDLGVPAAPPRRREALRRVAALTGLAVLSVVTPSPAQVAATCRPNGDPCNLNAQCCSNCCNTSSGRCAGGGCQLGGAARPQ